MKEKFDKVFDDRNELIETFMREARMEMERQSPRFYRNPRFVSNWFESIASMPDDSFHSNFRMSRECFSYIVREIGPKLMRNDTQFKLAIPVEKRIAIGIKVLATNMEMINVGQLFGVGTTSVWRCFHDFVDCVNGILMPKHLKMPSHAEFRSIATKFERKFGFPMTVGAVDGCHIPIKVPKDQAASYYNYKGWHSSLCLAICDCNYKVCIETMMRPYDELY